MELDGWGWVEIYLSYTKHLQPSENGSYENTALAICFTLGKHSYHTLNIARLANNTKREKKTGILKVRAVLLFHVRNVYSSNYFSERIELDNLPHSRQSC